MKIGKSPVNRAFAFFPEASGDTHQMVQRGLSSSSGTMGFCVVFE
ncbi:MAG: hypothetical protein V4689_01665 [Verrucomicrobiota bacterium]